MALELLTAVELLLTLLVVYVLYCIVANTVISPLRHVPGPWYYAVSKVFYIAHLASGLHSQWIRDLHKKYGSTVRVAPNIVSIRDVDAIHAIFASHKFTKGPIYSAFDVTGTPNVFSERDPAAARIRRKLAIPMFTRSAIKDMDEMIMSSGIRPLFNQLEEHADAGDTTNLLQLFQCAMLGIIGYIASGRDFNLLKDKSTSEKLLIWIRDTLQLCIYQYAVGPLANKWLLPRLHESKRRGIEFVLEAIRVRRATENPRPDSFSRYMAAIQEEKIEHITDLEIAGDMIAQVTIYLLSLAPDVHARLLQELREAVPDINTEIRHKMVCSMPYLDAVINESLRIYPVGGENTHRLVPKGGLELDGKYLPEGTAVMITQHMTNHWDKFWDEPAAFRPERWLDSDSARLSEMKRAFFPFSTGVRACVGRELAWMNLRVTLASLVRRFEVEVIPGADMTPIFNLSIGPRGNTLNCRLRKRTE
ncbi:cytochrome P450 [Thamnocephalis sphaerospora]|uniref:Cytochrome P450 n=1 Tax=Thamnocephalis sphaerospora TaxID=78915 RepID=A0A4P9XKK6_9FUNG|nr:cytochrome P450 [Thamnocephalis sphaerospora]|eukprot:RKP06344.1 cytochrome P450 [Thamnocephalis sphaerospora]